MTSSPDLLDGTKPELSEHVVPPPPAAAAPLVPTGPTALGRAGSSLGWAALGAVLTLALWRGVATRAPDLPTPVEGLGELVRLVSRPFYDNGPNDKGVALQLAVSLRRVGGGFVLAALAGVPTGLALGASRRVWRTLNPVVQVLRPVSPLAWFPVWLTVFKDTGRASVFVIFITALWPIVLNTAAGADGVPADQRNVARVFRFGRWATMRHVLVPNALPSIVTGLRLSMGIAWMVIVAVEMLAGGSGIGYFVWDSYNASNLPAVIASIIVIGTVGLLLDLVFQGVARRVSPEGGAS